MTEKFSLLYWHKKTNMMGGMLIIIIIILGATSHTQYEAQWQDTHFQQKHSRLELSATKRESFYSFLSVPNYYIPIGTFTNPRAVQLLSNLWYNFVYEQITYMTSRIIKEDLTLEVT